MTPASVAGGPVLDHDAVLPASSSSGKLSSPDIIFSNLVKNIFDNLRAVLVIRHPPSWAILPPVWALASYFSNVLSSNLIISLAERGAQHNLLLLGFQKLAFWSEKTWVEPLPKSSKA